MTETQPTQTSSETDPQTAGEHKKQSWFQKLADAHPRASAATALAGVVAVVGTGVVAARNLAQNRSELAQAGEEAKDAIRDLASAAESPTDPTN